MGKLHIVTGAAGFVGRCLVKRLLDSGDSVAGLDNLSRGNLGNIAAFRTNPEFSFERLELADRSAYDIALASALRKYPDRAATVWHMAANSDIVAGVDDPAIDLRDTFLTTFNTLAAMRAHGLRELAFASSSAVYGPLDTILHEDSGPLFPISNYGAMKLASEAAISAGVEAFLQRAWIFRFPNVVGPFATHGVIYDFVHKLKRTPDTLDVLGDGNQKKAYLPVDELVDAMIFINGNAKAPLNCFNIGPADDGATVRFIAEETVRVVAPGAAIRYGSGSKGWVGDVPRMAYSIEKLRALGWAPRSSSEAAIKTAVEAIWQENS